jgi:hypothetical protein
MTRFISEHRRPERPPEPPGLGDRLAHAIAFVAKLLHVERWVKETAGCGCQRRRETLNAWGRWLTTWRR